MRAIAFNPNSQQIVARLDSGNIQVRDTTTGKPVRSWTAHGSEITAIATPSPITLSASGDTFAVLLSGLTGPSVSSGFGLDLREVVTDDRLFIISNARQISFSPKNLSLVSTESSDAKTWQP